MSLIPFTIITVYKFVKALDFYFDSHQFEPNLNQKCYMISNQFNIKSIIKYFFKLNFNRSNLSNVLWFDNLSKIDW